MKAEKKETEFIQNSFIQNIFRLNWIFFQNFS